MPSKKEAKPGFTFQVMAPGDHPIQQLRDDAKAEYGLDIHIRLKAGPTVVKEDGKSLGCPIEAIDDDFLEGQFQFPIPAPGNCIYIGYFLPPKEG